MKKETLFILLGIGGLGAYLIYLNRKKKGAESPIDATTSEPAVISTRPAVINPIANPIIDDSMGIPDLIKPRESKGMIGNVITDPRKIELIQKEYEKALERERLRNIREYTPLPDPMLKPIIRKKPAPPTIEKKPIRTSPTYTLPKYTDEENINQGVDVEPFTKPAIPTTQDKIKSDSEVYTIARKMLNVEKGRINFKDKQEQDNYLARANKSAYPKRQIEQVPYGLPIREKEYNFTYN